MDIFVLSRSRFENSDTLMSLGEEAAKVKLIVPKIQQKEYKSLTQQYNCDLVPCPFDGVSMTRKFCGDIAKDWCFLMLDDDLRFYRRIDNKVFNLRYPSDLEDTARTLLALVESKLRKYIHVAVSAREGNNRLPFHGVECSRPLRALAYRTAQFRKLEHGRVKIMEDFDITLQLLRQGYKNHVIASWAQGQKQTQMAGGCSDYRTKELHEENVKKFAKLHEGFVKLRQKHNKSGGEFGHRLEATIYWQRAWQSSQKDSTE